MTAELLASGFKIKFGFIEMIASEEIDWASPELLRELTAKVVAGYVSNNAVPLADLPALIDSVRDAFLKVSGGVEVSADQGPTLMPAVNPKKSITADYIICLEDGKKFKSLKRHLRNSFGLTPEQYRVKWNLGPSYPMVAPNYSATRSELASKMGLGRKPKTVQ